jgi:hypothetical protein
MNEQYEKFFNTTSRIYNGPGGCNSLLSAIDSDELIGELGGKEYNVAKRVLLDFLKEHNTHPSNRIFGISTYDCRELVKKCEEKEEILSNPLQAI